MQNDTIYSLQYGNLHSREIIPEGLKAPIMEHHSAAVQTILSSITIGQYYQMVKKYLLSFRSIIFFKKNVPDWKS